MIDKVDDVSGLIAIDGHEVFVVAEAPGAKPYPTGDGGAGHAYPTQLVMEIARPARPGERAVRYYRLPAFERSEVLPAAERHDESIVVLNQLGHVKLRSLGIGETSPG